MPEQGKRKVFVFLVTCILYTSCIMFAIAKQKEFQIDMPTFAFQLSFGYSVLSGLFYGSNVATYFSKRPEVPTNNAASGVENADNK